MTKLRNMMMISFVAMLFANGVFAKEKTDETSTAVIWLQAISGAAFVTSFGQYIPYTIAAGAVVVTSVITADMMKNENSKQLKELIYKEAAVFETTGVMGMLLENGVNTLQNENPELSDAEAVDALISAIK